IGSYQIRQFVGKRPVYTELGNDPTDALSRYRAAESKAKAWKQAIIAGLEVITPDDDVAKPTLKVKAKAFIQKHRDSPHRSDDALLLYERVLDTFMDVTKAKYV